MNADISQEELFYAIALTKVNGIGPILAKRLIEFAGSAKQVFFLSSKELMLVPKISDLLLRKLSDKRVLERADAEIEAIIKHNITVYYFLSDKYPFLLKQCIDCPILLYSSSALFDWSDRKVISIIGTRQPSSRGMDFCQKIISDLAEFNPIIVSGLAYGIDICAHKAALDCNLQTVAILGHGLERIYPEQHKFVAQQIEKSGSILTEFPLYSKVDRENFIQRNRIVAGLSQTTIVIESALRGGAMSTISFANDYNREVFAVPGRINDITSQGCNEVIRTQRAQLLTSSKEIVEGLNWNQESRKVKSIQPELFVDLSADEKAVYDYLVVEQRELLDLIALGTELPIYKVSNALLNLELKGLIRPLPGRYFEIV
ncbi:DNA-protecting protein DprA [Myroides sp. BIT-d1]|uniref:DNA-protecting protein DprA n=1 Tax=Myroides albus TaxID=2562892 RepID=A0A6I3LJZ7_9FLAO|nr:DNA-processing protein DprA [Myroides albus]MTG97896.1 DNA-protecting protein DprA [Myroides albus]